MLQDVRYALRRVLRSPAFSLGLVLVLAAGIGAATGMAGVSHALAFRAIAVPRPGTLIAVSSVTAPGAWRTTPLLAIEHLEAASLPARGWCGYNTFIEATEAGGVRYRPTVSW